MVVTCVAIVVVLLNAFRFDVLKPFPYAVQPFLLRYFCCNVVEAELYKSKRYIVV